MELKIKQISGCEDYVVTNDGRVFNTKTGEQKKPSINEKGYLTINIRNKIFRIHRLVAYSFIPNIYGKPQINHKDGNKHNNTVENLEWVTSSENIKHAYLTGLHRTKKVGMFSKSGEYIRTFNSITEAAKFFGRKNGQQITDCIHGRLKSAYGYLWQAEQ